MENFDLKSILNCEHLLILHIILDEILRANRAFLMFFKVSEDRHYMKRKEAGAFEEQLLKQKMDELHKKLHQVVELSHKDLPASQNRPDVRSRSSLL